MDPQLERAISICYTANAPVELRRQALGYLDRVKASPGSWRFCLEYFVQSPDSLAETKFFALQVVEDALRNRTAVLPANDVTHIRLTLLEWLRTGYRDQAAREPAFMKNKVALLVVLVFAREFPTAWPSFADDTLGLLEHGDALVDLYLRIALTLDEEIIARVIMRSESEAAAATHLVMTRWHGFTDAPPKQKDALRADAIPRMIDAWYRILMRYHTTDATLTNLCLQVICRYVEWTDVNLIASERFVSAFYSFLNSPLLREAACACVDEIVLKGMRASAKVQLVQALQLPAMLMAFSQENLEGVISEPFALKVAHLSNDIVVVLASCWSELGAPDDASSDYGGVSFSSMQGLPADAAGSPQDSAPNSVEGSPTRRRAGAQPAETTGSSRSLGRHQIEATPLSPAQRQAQEDCYDVLERCLPLLFKILASSNQRLSSSVFNGVQAFLVLVKQLKASAQHSVPARQLPALERLLEIVVDRMRMPSDYDALAPDDDEEEFQQYRRFLRQLLESISGLNEEMVLTYAHTIVQQTLQNLSGVDFTRAELAIFLIHCVADGIRGPASVVRTSKGVIKFVRDGQGGRPAARLSELHLSAMLNLLLSSNASEYGHAAVQLAYFECIVRFARYFEAVPEALDLPLRVFLSDRRLPRSPYARDSGLLHPNAFVRSEVTRQFARFVRALRPRLAPHVHWILTSLRGLLSDASVLQARPRAPARVRPTVAASPMPPCSDAGADQMNLYETAGLLVAMESITNPERAEFLKLLLQPLLSQAEETLARRLYTSDTPENPVFSDLLHHHLMAIGSVAKGFSVHSGVPGGWEAPFTASLQLAIAVLDALPDTRPLKDAARFLFQRMVVALGRELLPYLAPMILRLVRDCHLRDVIDIAPVLGQLVFRFKATLLPMLDELLGGLLERFFAFLAAPAETLLAAESLAPINGVDELRAEALSPNEPESVDSSGVGSPDTMSEPDMPSGRTFADMQMSELRKSYLNLLLSVFTADMGNVFLSEANRRHFEALVGSVLSLAATATEMAVIKQAVSVLVRMVDAWAPPGAASPFSMNLPSAPTIPGSGPVRTASATDAETSRAAAARSAGLPPPLSAAQLTSLSCALELYPAMDRMILEQILPACFSLPVLANIKATDAESTLLVMNEIAVLQRHVVLRMGLPAVQFLSTRMLPSLGLSETLIQGHVPDGSRQDYMVAIHQPDPKAFKQFFRTLVTAPRR